MLSGNPIPGLAQSPLPRAARSGIPGKKGGGSKSALLAKKRDTAIREERSRIASQIHDTLAQAFTGMLLHLEALRVRAQRGDRLTGSDLQVVRNIAALGLAEARRSVCALRPLALDGRDLPFALSQLAERSTVPEVLHCRWTLKGTPRALLPLVEEVMLGVAHEAVNNAIRHAQAAKIHITLTFASDHISLLVKDDGVGFSRSKTHEDRNTFGLRSMREHATSIGARLFVESRPAFGTTIRLTLSTL